MAEQPNRRVFKEIEAERFLLREPHGGRVRAILETAPPRGPDTEVKVPTVRLILLTPTGEPALVAEVDEAGSPPMFIGAPDGGTTIILSREAVDLWHSGNVVASLRSSAEGGQLELTGADGALVTLPK